ncbi:hypothetical protein BG003_001027 [Podila horticola]|nr:hypothetical protein BG003_001027 [Podila horticola]
MQQLAPSLLTLDDNEASPLSAPSVLIRGGISDLQDAAPSSEEVLLNDTSSPSVSVPGPPVLSLPTDRPRVPQHSAAGAEWPFQLSKHLTQSLKILAQEHDVDMSAILLAAWSAVLFRLSGQQEFNITVHGLVLDRQVMVAHRSANSSLRIDLSGDPSTVQLLKLLKIAALASDDHQLDIEQVAFRFSREEAPSTVGQELSSPRVPLGGFELQLNLKHEDDRIVGVMDYAMALFDSLTIERHVGYLSLMLMGMASDVMQLVSKIDIISPAERLLLFDTWNNQPMASQEFPTIHQLFEDQVKRTPKAIAIVHEDQKITYAELNARSNRLAHRLIQLGVRPDACVAICVDKSIAMIVGILAVLKAGGAYIPLDPFYASDRLEDIIIDAAPTILVADSAGKNALGEATLSAITLVDPDTLDLTVNFNDPRGNRKE